MMQNTPQDKDDGPTVVIKGTFEIDSNGRVAWVVSRDEHVMVGSSAYGYAVAITYDMMAQVNKLWYLPRSQEWEARWLGRGGGGVALQDIATCRNCDQAVNPDEMIPNAHGGHHCPRCDENYDAFNREIERFEDVPRYREGDICPGAFHGDYWCDFCIDGGLTAEGAADINAELKAEHERKLTQIIDAMPHSELAKIVRRNTAFTGLKPRRDPNPVDDLPW